MCCCAFREITQYPPDLRRLNSEDLCTLCGQCHRTWEMVVRSHWRGKANVCFQPYPSPTAAATTAPTRASAASTATTHISR
jgi:hypothetical protein